MSAAAALRPALRRPPRMLLAGVCAGVARHLGWSASAVRVLAVVLALLGGGGILLYLWLWALVPLDDDETQRVRRTIPGAAILVSLAGVTALVAIGSAYAGATTPLVAGLIQSTLLAGAAVAWTLVLDRTDPHYDARYRRVVGIVAGAVLLVEGLLLLLAPADPVAVILGVIVAVLGVVILIVPRIADLWTELMAERSARDRDAQRAEIAAHLHDSVLQTLAIIQHRAGPQSEVARLARAQERELRDWLFAGTDPFAGDAATELRAVAGELELAHPVRFEVVTVGDASEVRSTALIGAAREAMLNAARHAGGDISVYLEVTEGEVEIYVRDRGPGFDPDDVPESRIGVRESIVGRMERAGGRAEVRSDARGTEVRLRLPLAAATGGHQVGGGCQIDRGRQVRVLLVDDHSIFRSGLRAELPDDIEVVGEASTADDAVRMAHELRPDVVLLDVHLPGSNGGGAGVLRGCADLLGDVRFLALSVSDAAEDVVGVIRAGARGYITKSSSGAEVADALRSVADGDAVFSPRLAGFVLDAFGASQGEQAESVDELDRLSAREREVMRLIARGYAYKEVAAELYISIKTVETHVSAVLRKLQLSSRHELTAWALERKLL